MGGESSAARCTSDGARALPPELLAALRDAFAEEVAGRGPRVRALVAERPAAGLLAEVRRDAHNLIGSAVVVGAEQVARAARGLEDAFGSGDPTHVTRCAERLVQRLDEWSDEWAAQGPGSGS